MYLITYIQKIVLIARKNFEHAFFLAPDVLNQEFRDEGSRFLGSY